MKSQKNNSSAKLVFLHIPKSAGTSFRRIMQNEFGREKIAWRDQGLELEHIQSLIESGRDFRVIGGHFSYRKAQEFFSKDYIYFATLREPLERVVSLYNYILRTPSHHLNPLIEGMSFLEALDEVPLFRNQVSNLQCSYLSATKFRSFKDAVKSVVKNNIRVNIIDHSTIMLEEASKVLGLKSPPKEIRMNSSKGSRDYSSILKDDVLLERLTELNQHDLRLYKRISGLFAGKRRPDYQCLKRLQNDVTKWEKLEKVAAARKAKEALEAKKSPDQPIQ